MPVCHEVLCLCAGVVGEESFGVLFVQRSSLSVHTVNLEIELIVPELLTFPHMRVHAAVLGVRPVSYQIEGPPCGGRREGITISVAFGKALRHAVDAAVHRDVARASGIVHAEPEDTLLALTHLCHKGPSCLLGSRRTLIPVLEGIRTVDRTFEAKATETQFTIPRAGIGTLGDIERRILVLIAHALFHVLRRHFAVRNDPERHMFAFVLPLALAESFSGSVIKVAIHVIAEMVKERPYACLADIESAEVKGVVGGLEREVLVGAGEVTFLAREINKVLIPHPVSVDVAVEFLIEFGFLADRELGDTGLVSMCSNRIIRNTHCYPVSTFSTGTFTDQIHDPYLVGVAEGERLPFGSIAVLVHQFDEALDCFTCRFRTLQSNIDEASVVDTDGIP